jgi:hypothetical protein
VKASTIDPARQQRQANNSGVKPPFALLSLFTPALKQARSRFATDHKNSSRPPETR